MPVTEEQLEDVAKYSEVLETGSDFLEEEVRKACEEIIPFPERVEPTECMEAFVFFKKQLPSTNIIMELFICLSYIEIHVP